MKRPNIADYSTTNQIEYREQLNKYYEELEKYCDILEKKLNDGSVTEDKIHYDALLDCCNQLLDGVDMGITPVRSIMGLRILLNRNIKTKK